jgi:hypothetical protein
MEDFLAFSIPVYLLEMVAALTGLYYIRLNPHDKAARIFVVFLCITVIVEWVGVYAVLGYFSGYEYFGFIEGTPFEKNYWWYNLYNIASFVLYAEYFRRQLYNKVLRHVVLFAMILFGGIEIVNLVVHPEMFFNNYSAFASIAGTILVLASISLYYYQLMTNDDILQFKRLLPFYVSVGAIILHITHTPLFIYSKYFSTTHGKEFVEMYRSLMFLTNVMVYLIFSIGFMVCLRKKGSSSYIL